jgi:hypothetical protein
MFQSRVFRIVLLCVVVAGSAFAVRRQKSECHRPPTLPGLRSIQRLC